MNGSLRTKEQHKEYSQQKIMYFLQKRITAMIWFLLAVAIIAFLILNSMRFKMPKENKNAFFICNLINTHFDFDYSTVLFFTSFRNKAVPLEYVGDREIIKEISHQKDNLQNLSLFWKEYMHFLKIQKNTPTHTLIGVIFDKHAKPLAALALWNEKAPFGALRLDEGLKWHIRKFD